ncbi:S2/P23 family protein [Borreliella japonica]|uniref:S2/P23 family protein n=1 Tax=Borreliella japonica TaxID=34095 RepID=UPI002649408E|nr:S2/P23 family protein [Borreliella japonica]WKC87849.1 S2/P23 family protein [Borreliella japonica]
MIFKTCKRLKLITMLMLILSCAFFKKPQSVQQDSDVGKPISNEKSSEKPQPLQQDSDSDIGKPTSDEKLHLLLGKILNKKLPIINSNHDVTWIKTKAMTILDEYGQAISEFKNKFGYSYILSPIKMDDKYSSFTSLLILFETTKNGDKEYEIENIKFITAGSNLELKDPLLVVENSQEEGYVTAYPFGILMSDELKNAFKLTYQNGHWNYMLANLTVKNKLTQKTKTYKISLNSKLIIDFLKEVIKENSILKDTNGDLFEDI